MSMIQKIEIDGKQVPFKASAAIPRIYRIKFHRDIYKDLDALGKAVGNGDEVFIRILQHCKSLWEKIQRNPPHWILKALKCLRTSPTSWQSTQILLSRTARRNGLMSSAPSPSTRYFRKSSSFGA